VYGRPSWRHPRVLLTLALVFLSGALAGVLAGRFTTLVAKPQSMRFWREGGKELSLQKLKKELDLTPQQTGEMEAILDDFVQYYDALQSQMDGVRANCKDRVVAMLTREQQQKFERLLGGLQPKQIK